MYVLENTSNDSFNDNCEFKGKVAVKIDIWAIGGFVFKYDEQLSMI